mmetsp:Transcript_64825/g.180437  ORF Transcript_64825/g.180437 Transcript_64825/m.180437 type:complete len:228 (+) Transcript_64825:1230-1913(+)
MALRPRGNRPLQLHSPLCQLLSPSPPLPLQRLARRRPRCHRHVRCPRLQPCLTSSACQAAADGSAAFRNRRRSRCGRFCELTWWLSRRRSPSLTQICGAPQTTRWHRPRVQTRRGRRRRGKSRGRSTGKRKGKTRGRRITRRKRRRRSRRRRKKQEGRIGRRNRRGKHLKTLLRTRVPAQLPVRRQLWSRTRFGVPQWHSLQMGYLGSGRCHAKSGRRASTSSTSRC